MEENEEVLSFVKRLKTLSVWLENGLQFTGGDRDVAEESEDSEAVAGYEATMETYSEVIDDLHKLFPEVFAYDGKYYNYRYNG
jgi:hypothetical protein